MFAFRKILIFVCATLRGKGREKERERERERKQERRERERKQERRESERMITWDKDGKKRAVFRASRIKI